MSFFGSWMDVDSMENKDFDRLKDAVRYQEMTDEEKTIADNLKNTLSSLQAMGPQVLAQYGLIQDSNGKIRALTDSEAKSILPADQYALYQAKNQEAQALASGQLPDYQKAELERQNATVLNAANKRLGPGGYITSTPGNTALNQVQQNTAETINKNRNNQVGLLNSYYGIGSNIANNLPNYSNSVLSAGEGLLKNVYYPFHDWANVINQANIGATGNVVSQMVKAQGEGMIKQAEGIGKMMSGGGGMGGMGGGGTKNG